MGMYKKLKITIHHLKFIKIEEENEYAINIKKSIKKIVSDNETPVPAMRISVKVLHARLNHLKVV